MKKKFTSALLLAALLASTACGESVTSDETTAGADTETTTNETTTQAETTAPSKLPAEFDCEGYELRVIKQRQDKVAWSLNTFGVLEDNGEVLNDAFAKRNRDIGEKYNFTIVETETDSTPVSTVRQSVLAGDDEYDVVLASFRAERNSSDETYYDLFKLPHLDLERDCWNQSLVRDLSVNGSLYFVSGDIIVSDDDGLMLNVYNKPLGEDYKFENLYDVVREGRWTYDYKLGLMRQVADDLNGDGVYDTNDRLGMLYADNSAAAPYFASAGAYLFTRTNDAAEFTGDSERAYSIYEKIQSILSDETIAYNWANITQNSSETIVSMIDAKKVLFLDIGLHFVRRNLRDLKADYSILPLPKLDEEQEYYSTQMNESMSHMLVPASIGEPEKVGLILEALAEASGSISETYYKTCIEGKYARDAESVEMLNLASEHVVFDLGFINNWGGLGVAIRQGEMNGSSYASLIASMKTAAISEMENYFKK